jgi:uncharacterized membrane-anchored protein
MKHLAITAALLALAFHAASGQKPEAPPPADAEAQAKQMIAEIETFGWTREGEGPLGSHATVAIPRGYRFTGPSGTKKMLEMTGNRASDRELGMLTTEGIGPWIIFEFSDVGYVKDDEKDSLDADKLMETLKAGQEADNVERKKVGMRELELLGWAVPPRYNPQTNNLEWATRIRSKGGTHVSINYNTRLLGRRGVMEVALICDPEEMESLLPDYQHIMGGFQYTKGESYAEYRKGDKVAQYGLAALVAGGAAVAAGKMGLLAKLGSLLGKLGKGVIVLVVAVAAVFKNLWNKITGRASS